MRLQLHALAYNLATFLRCIELPEAMADWSLTSLQLKLIKIGARVVRHARAITFQLAEVAVTGRWCGPSLPPSAVFERLRHAHDHDPCPS
nr:transposase [Thioclava nitratireducens]